MQPLDFKDLDFGNTAGMPTECKLPVAGNETSNIPCMEFGNEQISPPPK